MFEKVGAGAYRMFQKCKAIMFVSSREIVADSLIFEEKDGTVIQVVSSKKQ